jgi:hypothetical protein
MLSRILPARIDNRYRGHVLALWLFVPIAIVKLALGLVHIFRTDGGAQSVAMIPLDSYPPSAADNIVGLFARLGLEQLLLASLFIVILLRYRALIPLMYFLLVAHYAGSRLLSELKPLARSGASGVGTFALVIATLTFAGPILSLIGRRYREEPLDR